MNQHSPAFTAGLACLRQTYALIYAIFSIGGEIRFHIENKIIVKTSMIYHCYLQIYLSLTIFTVFVFWDRQVDFFLTTSLLLERDGGGF